MEPRRASRTQLAALRGAFARASGLRRSQVRVRVRPENIGCHGVDTGHVVIDVRVTPGDGVYRWSRVCHAEWSHRFVRRLARGFAEGHRTGARVL